HARLGCRVPVAERLGLQAVAGAVDGKSLLVEQVPDAPNEQHFVVLVIAAVAAALDRLELRELLLPVAEHMRLHRAQIADLANREVALGGNRRQVRLNLPGYGHGSQLRPLPSVSDWRER